MPRGLAVHNAECNEIYFASQKCEEEHPFRRFLGQCTDLHKQVDKCIKELRVKKREENYQKALEKRRKMADALPGPKSNDQYIDSNDVERIVPHKESISIAATNMDLRRNNVTSLDLTPGKAELCTDSTECCTDKKSEMNDKDLIEFSCSKVDNNLFPDDTDVSDMLQGTEFNGTLPTATDRYFTPYYQINVPKSGDDICIRVHSNRICMISLAPSHTVLQEGKRIVKINFKISDKVDRSSNRVSGKSKHGAQPLQPDSSICSIICSDGETYVIKCCMTGKLVEVNELLLENPEMLLQPPHRGGYLAIALPNIKLIDEMKKKWLTQELYNLAIQRRQSQSKITNFDTQSNTDESSRNNSAEKKVLKRKQNDESPINYESPCEREAKVVKENDTESL